MNYGQFGPWLIRPQSIRTLKNSALVNSDLDHWSIRTPTTGQFGPFFIGQFGPQKEKFFGQFGPFPLVNSDLFQWSIRTFSNGQFGPLHYVFFIKKTVFRLKTSRPNIKNETSIRIQCVLSDRILIAFMVVVSRLY